MVSEILENRKDGAYGKPTKKEKTHRLKSMGPSRIKIRASKNEPAGY